MKIQEHVMTISVDEKDARGLGEQALNTTRKKPSVIISLASSQKWISKLKEFAKDGVPLIQVMPGIIQFDAKKIGNKFRHEISSIPLIGLSFIS
ncbi:hypothetical protein D918_05589 [Trichuris suis]|nr:hypothetical protein D918_05589 [Trichuris suis]